MRVAICSVGSELLSGHVADTNAAWLAQKALESGCSVAAVLIVGDDHAALLEAFRWLADRADVLIVGGGLGPTADDITRDAVAEFAGVDLERRQDLVDHLERTYARFNQPMPASNLRQADVPEGASVHQHLGTAAGFALDVDRDGRKLRVHVLPGVPWEYKQTAEAHIIPELVRLSGGLARVTHTVHVAGVGEAAVGESLSGISSRLLRADQDPDDAEHGIELGFLAASDEVLVRITGTAADPQAVRDRLTPIVDEVIDALGEAVTSVDERRLEDEVTRLLMARGATVATAEAVTAGRVAALLSSVPNAAQSLQGAVVAPTPATMTAQLDVDPAVLAKHGRTHPAVVEAMAVSVRERFGTDFALATVGVAGPDNEDGEPPIGTTMWAVVGPDGAVEHGERYIRGDRDIVQARGAAFALETLRRKLAAGTAE